MDEKSHDLVSTASAATAVKVYVAGDSTASTYTKPYSPRTGWGQALPVFLTAAATVVDHAKSGAGSQSFVDSGLLTPILSGIKSGACHWEAALLSPVRASR